MKKLGIAVVVIAVLAVVATVALKKLTHTIDTLLPDPEQCTASVGGHTATLTPEQAGNAALITAIAVRRGLPARAATIAIATAMQESKLYNLTTGDRDSLGLFQQRPSQGWGTRTQILDPVHATNAFYDALVKIDGYQTMVITEAAQRVQRSGYPEAYAQHEPDGRALASALTGYSTHAFGCRLDVPQAGSGKPRALRRELTRLYGDLIGTPTVRGSTMTVPIPAGGTGPRNGWSAAQYLVAQADRFGIRSVSYAGRRWSAGKSDAWHTGTASVRRITVTLG